MMHDRIRISMIHETHEVILSPTIEESYLRGVR